MKTEVFKLTVLVVDHDGIGAKAAKLNLENGNFANRCISPYVMDMETRVVDWTDDHPLNFFDRMKETFYELFREKKDDPRGNDLPEAADLAE